MNRRRQWLGLALLALCFAGISCKRTAPANEVTLACGVDGAVAQSVLAQFEKETGIHVIVRRDGTAARLLAERGKAQADVWWSADMLATVRLCEEGVFAADAAAPTAGILSRYKDAGGRWAGNALRVRVLAVTRIGDGAAMAGTVHHLADMTHPAFKDHIAWSGLPDVTAFHGIWGNGKADGFFNALKENGLKTLSGSELAQQVGQGTIWVGVCDASDVWAAQAAGGKLDAVLPDQDGAGTLAMPCTVALVSGAAHPQQARKLVDFLLSSQVEQKLLDAHYAQYSVFRPETTIKIMDVNWQEAARKPATEPGRGGPGL